MPDDAIERAHWSRQSIAGIVIQAIVASRSGKGMALPAGRAADEILTLLAPAFASQQAPEGWAIALHLSKQDEGACITSIVLSVHNGTSEADALKRAIDYAAVEKPGFAVEQYLAQKYPPAMLDAAPSVTLGEVG